MYLAPEQTPSWVERYRPHTVSDCILPAHLKATFEEIVKQGTVPNIILTGPPGGGKTTVARAICEELDLDYILIPASERGNIDTLRVEIREFASARSFDGARRVVIFDEADYLNQSSTQPALRNFTEEFASNVSFIYTCNNLARIIPALHSRASIIEYTIPKDEMGGLISQFYKRCKMILDKEQAEYDPETIRNVLGQLIMKYWPDMRRVLNELQIYSIKGSIDADILNQVRDAPLEELIEAIKHDDFRKARAWCAAHGDSDSVKVMRRVYDLMYELFEPECIPALTLIVGEYIYRSAFISDHEIHMCAFLTAIMNESVLKK